MTNRQVVIVGAGPTGATLALLLAQHGVRVTLVEAAKDFRRVFRGEGLMPSGLEALEQMGLTHLLDTIPSRPLDAWEFIIGGKSLFRVDEPMGSNTPDGVASRQRPCTLVSQPALLDALITEAQQHGLELIQGVAVKDVAVKDVAVKDVAVKDVAVKDVAVKDVAVKDVAVKDVLWSQAPRGSTTSIASHHRVAGVVLADGRTLDADLVIGADGRNSIVRQRVGLELETEPKSIDILWFKLPSHPRLVENNTFYSIVNQKRVFSIFHSTTVGQMHLAWVVYPDAGIDQKQSSKAWAETFAELSPDWLAAHFRQCADADAEEISSPIKLSVIVGCCPTWHQPGVLVLGDAAHPMSPVRAQGINMALRDVIVAVNHLVPIFQEDSDRADNDRKDYSNNVTPEARLKKIDGAIAAIQSEREPEIIRIQKLQAEETHRGNLLRSNPFLRNTVLQCSPISGPLLKKVWTHKQQSLRHGITSVHLATVRDV